MRFWTLPPPNTCACTFITLLILQTPTCLFKVYNFRGGQLLMFLVQNIQVAFAKQQRTCLENRVTTSRAQSLSWKQRQHRARQPWPRRCVIISSLSHDCACAKTSYPLAKCTSTGQPGTSAATELPERNLFKPCRLTRHKKGVRDYLQQTTRLKLKWLDGMTWYLGN